MCAKVTQITDNTKQITFFFYPYNPRCEAVLIPVR